MATVVLDAYSKAFPSITNRIRAAVFLETDLLAPVATIIDTTAGHPQRIYHFPGLPRANYAFSLDEIDGSDIPINNLALFDVVPSGIPGFLSRADEQIKVGTTPGFDAATNVAVFDGAETSFGSGIFKPDYRGWDIVPSELTGRGILVEGLDYSWDSVTGTLTLLQAGDNFPDQQWYNIHFNPINDLPADSVPTVIDFQSRVVTADTTVALSDFGGTLICEPASSYIVLTLPLITTVAQGRPLTIEVIKAIGNGVSCVKVLPNGADVMNFLDGSLYMMNNESLQIYRFRRVDLSNEWRIRLADGNFKTLGESVGDDAIQSGVYCKQLMDGSSKDKFQYARIYNQYVLKLPLTQVVNYDAWTTGNNKYLYSLANSGDPGNANKFHFPDRRGLFEKNNNSGKAGDYADDSVKINAGVLGVKVTGHNTVAGAVDDDALQFDLNGAYEIAPMATETQPKNTLINKYVRI